MRWPFGAVLAVLVAMSCVAPARAPAQTTVVLTPATRQAALSAIESAIRTTYVFPEMRAPLIARLDSQAGMHRYDTADPNVFAERVTDDMQSVAHDGHLYMTYDPAEYAALMAPPKSDAGMDAYYRAIANRQNSGLTEMKILPGNIRYLKITAFDYTPGITTAAYDDAGRFLHGGDAIIIDLRGNGGGDSDAADYFGKALIDPNSGRPVYILVDGHVASAAEAVSYGAKAAKEAIVVGSTTYGAANNNKKLPIAPAFVLSVSYNRPINPITKTNWEGSGVVPDIAVPGSTALPVAELNALDELLALPGAGASIRAEYTWARQGVEAELRPIKLSNQQLARYAGRYGTIVIRAVNGQIRLTRTDRPRWEKNILLVPLDSNGLFAVTAFDDLRLRFHTNSFDFLYGNEGDRDTFARS
ncbi:MAG: S41 family peptidase [Candidatus Tumulicola sp.]